MTPRSFLTANWSNLVMLNYEVEAGVLDRYVPAGTLLDRWQGHTFVSLVGFQFPDTRVLGLPIPFHRNFEEINLRFYVRRIVGDELRRGVVFIRELVPRHAIAFLARVIYNEPYLALPMRHKIKTNPIFTAEYSWRLNGRWSTIAAEAKLPATLPLPGSLDEFISEHYWGYTRQKNSSTVEYQVTHPPWPVSPATATIDADLAGLYGAELAAHLHTPASCFVAAGSRITVYRPQHLPLIA